MRRILLVAAFLVGLVVTIPAVEAQSNGEEEGSRSESAASIPAVEAESKYPAEGWWKVGGTPEARTIYRDADLWVVWNLAYVYSYDRVPTRWAAEVWIKNVGNHPVDLSCAGLTNPKSTREHIRRGGTEYIGYVPAEGTFCSHAGAGWEKTLRPGQTHKSYAIFHNVPWRRDTVSIDWRSGDPGATDYVRPWGRHLR